MGWGHSEMNPEKVILEIDYQLLNFHTRALCVLFHVKSGLGATGFQQRVCLFYFSSCKAKSGLFAIGFSAINGIKRYWGLFLSELCLTLSRGQPAMGGAQLITRDGKDFNDKSWLQSCQNLAKQLQCHFPQNSNSHSNLGFVSSSCTFISCCFTENMLTLLHGDWTSQIGRKL